MNSFNEMFPLAVMQPPPSLSICVQYSSTLLTLDVQFQTNPPLSPNDNQSFKRKYSPRMTIMCYQALSSGRPFVFSISSLILSEFPSSSSHLAEASLSAFSWLYTLVCAVQKYHEMSFIYNYLHF